MFHIGPQELFMLLCVVSFLTIIPGIFYVLTLYRALTRCAPESRAMEPGLVWLLFVPFFNLIWNFIVVFRVATSLGNEFRRRGVAAPADTGRDLGLAMSILACLGFIPLLGILCSLAGLVCWVLYWVKIADLSGRLAGPSSAPYPVG